MNRVPACVDLSSLPQAVAEQLLDLLLAPEAGHALSTLARADDLIVRILLPACRADLGDCLERHDAMTGRAVARLVLIDSAGMAAGLASGLPVSWVPLSWPATAQAAALGLLHAAQLCRSIGAAAGIRAADSSVSQGSYAERLIEALARTGLYDFEYDFSTGMRSQRLRELDALGLTPRTFDEMLQLVHPDDREMLRAAHERSRDTGCSYQVEMRIWIPADQAWRWTRSQAVVIGRTDSHPGFLTGTTYEIHHDRVARNELAQARMNLDQALAAAGMFAWEWDESTGSRQLIADGLGIASGTDQRRLENWLHPEDLDTDLAKLAAAVAGGGTYGNTIRLRAAGGTWLWIQMHGKVQAADGRIARFAGFGVDISAYHSINNELADARSLLETSLSAGGMYCWEWNLSTGQRRTVGPAREILGFDTTRIDDAVAHVHPDDAAIDEALVKRTLEHGCPYSNEFRLMRADGSIRWLYSRGYRSVDSGKVTRFSGVAIDVTELREAQARIGRLNRQLEIALDAAGLNPWSVDLESGARQPGPRDGLMFGRELTSVAQARALVVPEDQCLVDRMLRPQSLASERPEHLLLRVRNSVGELRWLSVHARARCDARGVPVELIGITCDVTDAQRAKRSLQAALAKLERVQRTTGVVLWEWTPQGGLQTQGSTGSSRPEPSLDSVHPLDRRRVKYAIARCRSRGENFDQEFRMTDADGSFRWVWAQGGRSDQLEGDEPRYSGILMDVSRAKLAELRLSESLAWQQQAIAAGELNLWRVDLDSLARSGGQLDRRIFGFAPRTLSEVEALIHPEDAAAARAAWRASVEHGQPYAAEYRISNAGAADRWLRARGQCIPSPEGTGRQMVGATLDVTEQHKVREDLQKALHAARQASDAKSAFLATVSHELRTPLNAVIGYSGLLASQTHDLVQQSNLKALRAGADQLLAVINDVLDFSRIEAGALALESIQFDPLECLEGAIQLVASSAEEKGLCLLGSCASDVPMLVGDPTRFRQIILNLLSNGVKFTQAGSVRASLEMTDCNGTHQLRLTVEDSGIGMSDETVRRVFDAFRQADESTSRRFGGSGLGLSIVQRLVALMQGGIEVETEPGRGSSFRVSIPVPPRQRNQAELRFQLPERLRVGLCVSSEVVRATLERQVRMGGAQVVHYHSPQSLGSVAGWSSRMDVLVIGRPILGYLATLDGWTDHASKIPLVVLSGVAHTPLPETGSAGERLVPISRSLKPSELHRALSLCASSRDGHPAALPPESKAPGIVHPEVQVLSVLVVEDNEVNRLLLEAQLDLLGIAPALVESGEAALRAMDSRAFDLVLMDVEMPGLDGMETTRRVRARAGPQPYIVAVTAHVLAEMQKGIRDAGMDDFVSKPVIAEDLRAAVDRARKSRVR